MATGFGSVGNRGGALAEKRQQKGKCKKKQVRVTINKRKRCLKLGAALPRPQEGDDRLLLAQFGLADDLGGLRDSRGRRPPSLKKLFQDINPQAYDTLLSGIRRGLGRIDEMAAASPNALFRPAWPGYLAGPLDRHIPDCAKGDPPTQSDSFTSSGSGGTVTATMTLGREMVLGLGLQSGDYSIQLQLTAGECDRFVAPECPTAAGVIDATDASKSRMSLSVAKGGVVLVSKSLSYEGQTRMHAQVGDDAKLDFINIDDTQTANIDLGGTTQAFGPISLLWTGIHHARVVMPAGTYDSGHSAVDIALTAGGVTVGANALGATASNIANDLDKNFADLVKKEIRNFKTLQADWNTPNRCVQLAFAPASGAHPLRRGSRGRFTARLKLQPADGRPPSGEPSGNWTLVNHSGATFSPSSGRGHALDFNYRVPTGSSRGSAKASLKAVGRAGVAADAWTQTIQGSAVPPQYVAEVTGGRVSSDSSGCGAQHGRVEYNARLSDSYSTTPGDPFYLPRPEAGPPTAGAWAYQETGSGTFTTDPCEDSPGESFGLRKDTHANPGGATFELRASDMRVTVHSFSWVSDDGSTAPTVGLQGIGEGSFPRSMVGQQTITVPLSLDETHGDTHVVGSGTLTLHRMR